MSLSICLLCERDFDTDLFAFVCPGCDRMSQTTEELLSEVDRVKVGRCECSDATYDEPASMCDRCYRLAELNEELDRRAEETELVGVA